jgi:delta-aminolevulinic acid dehydratase/porphobilinogen synthase
MNITKSEVVKNIYRHIHYNEDEEKAIAVLNEYTQNAVENVETELDAVFYLGVKKWFKDPEAELAKSNKATMAANAREIALKAIEKAEVKNRKAVEMLEELKEKIGFENPAQFGAKDYLDEIIKELKK